MKFINLSYYTPLPATSIAKQQWTILYLCDEKRRKMLKSLEKYGIIDFQDKIEAKNTYLLS